MTHDTSVGPAKLTWPGEAKPRTIGYVATCSCGWESRVQSVVGSRKAAKSAAHMEATLHERGL